VQASFLPLPLRSGRGAGMTPQNEFAQARTRPTCGANTQGVMNPNGWPPKAGTLEANKGA